MPYKLRFKVAVPDSPTAPLKDETVCIDFEPALLDDNLRRLVRSRINLEVMVRGVMEDEQFRKAFSQGGSSPSLYWAAEPMDVCKGEYNHEEQTVIPKGHYEPNGEWIPDHIVASAPTADALFDALLEDVDRVCEEIGRLED
jgi:hypothetical protein